MSGVKTYHQRIVLNSQGVPVIKGTRFKVMILVEEKLAWGWDAEEMHRQHPSLARKQIQAVMDYYADHREEIDHARLSQAADWVAAPLDARRRAGRRFVANWRQKPSLPKRRRPA